MRLTEEHGNADILPRLPRKIKRELPVNNMIYSLPIDTLPVIVDEIQKDIK